MTRSLLKAFVAVIPEHLPKTSPKDHAKYRLVFKRFRDFLKHEPRAADFTEANEAGFIRWLAERYSGFSAARITTRFRRIWRILAAIGQVEKPLRAKRIGTQRNRPPRRERWENNPPVAREDIKTLRDVYLSLYLPLRLRGKSEACKKQYVINLDAFGRFLGRVPVLSDLNDDTVGQFFASIVERGMSPATANKARNHILALWRLAARKRLVEEFPDVAKITEPKRTPMAWTPEDLAKLWTALQATEGTISGMPANSWWMALHHLLWWSAERIGAVLQLRWTDFDFESGWLNIPAQFRKFGLSDKATHFPDAAIEALANIRAPERDVILPWPKDRSLIWQDYKKILKRAGLPFDRKSMFHRMRKSAASHFEAAGGNATALLGHSSRSVTMAYLDPRIVPSVQTSAMLFTPGRSDDN